MSYNRFEPAADSALRKAVQTALACDDAAWDRCTLRSGVTNCRLSDGEETAIIAGAVAAAAAMAQRIKARYGPVPPQQLAAELGLTVAYSAEELREPYLYLGLYDPGSRTISLNSSAIEQVRQFITSHMLADLTPPGDIVRLVLYHEIFHALEEQTPDIYTRSRMLRRKALGLFPYRRGLAGASETGAVHFSRLMAETPYSPCIHERYLLLALGQLSIDFLPPSV